MISHYILSLMALGADPAIAP